MIHFRHIKRFHDICIIIEFGRKVDVQNHEFGWVRFQYRFFIIK